MPTVRASCPECGDVEFPSERVRARVCYDTGEGSYTFTCPECQAQVDKPAENRVLYLLAGAGVHIETWRRPGVQAPTNAVPFTFDDLIAFHDLLADDSALEAFMVQSRRGE
jgi:hypothetical protein